jgi:hypothetical protein
MYSSIHSLISVLDGGEWSASRPGRFSPRERAPGIHWIGGWVGPRAILEAVVKRKIPSPRRESNPRTPIVQPVAKRYIDWAITAPKFCMYGRKYHTRCGRETGNYKNITLKYTTSIYSYQMLLRRHHSAGGSTSPTPTVPDKTGINNRSFLCRILYFIVHRPSGRRLPTQDNMATCHCLKR